MVEYKKEMQTVESIDRHTIFFPTDTERSLEWSLNDEGVVDINTEELF
jgi:hypothetical protein